MRPMTDAEVLAAAGSDPDTKPFQAGVPFAEDGQSVVKERVFLDKTNPDILHNEITATDSALTAVDRDEELSPRPQGAMDENNCTEGNMHGVIGEDNYFISGNGYLMPARKGQQPSDLRYFRAAEKRK